MAVKHPTRAAVYVRISDDKLGESEGVGRQERDCRELAKRLGWDVAEVYVENDTSAYKRRTVRLPDGSTALRVVRPEFRRMLADLASGAANALIGYDLDRVARDPRDLEDLIDVVEAQRLPTRSVTGSLDLSTDGGITMSRVMIAMANKSSRDTSRRVARKHLDLAEQGKVGGGGIRSYGYARDGLTIDEAEAAIIRRIAARLLAGDSLQTITKTLNVEEIPTVRGRPWNPRSVQSVVAKARVAGLREHRGEIVGEAVWPAILDRDTWERVCFTMTSRATGASNQLRYWLVGTLLCGKCGHLLASGQTQRQTHRYWCSTTLGGCGGVAIHGLRTDAVVEGLILRYLGRKDVLSDLRATVSTGAAERARTEAEADEAQLRELAAMWSSRSITTPEYMQARTAIEERLRSWQAIVRATLPGAVRQLVAGDIEAQWKAFLPRQRQEVSRAVFPAGIRVRPSAPGLKSFDPDRLEPVDWKGSPR